MMNKAVIYVFVLTIAGDILNDNDFVAVTETDDLAFNIAVDKLSRVSGNSIIRKYGKFCAMSAEDFPMEQPLSFSEWLEVAFYNDEIPEISITPKAIVTSENFNKIEF